jgi:hypothetical protein
MIGGTAGLASESENRWNSSRGIPPEAGLQLAAGYASINLPIYSPPPQSSPVKGEEKKDVPRRAIALAALARRRLANNVEWLMLRLVNCPLATLKFIIIRDTFNGVKTPYFHPAPLFFFIGFVFDQSFYYF